jgi:hypothetical protein
MAGQRTQTGTVVKNISSPPLLFAEINVAGSGDNDVLAGTKGKKIKVVNYVVVAAASVVVKWKTSSGAELSGPMSFIANSGVSAQGSKDAWLFETALGDDLILNLGLAVSVGGHLCYYLAP